MQCFSNHRKWISKCWGMHMQDCGVCVREDPGLDRFKSRPQPDRDLVSDLTV